LPNPLCNVKVRDKTQFKITMFSDQAIKSSNQDLFGRKHFSQRIAQIIVSRMDKESIVIGIHAPWGEGKTSVLNMIEEELNKHAPKQDRALMNDNIIVLKFNPWRFPDEHQLLKNYFYSLAEKLDSSLETAREKVGSWFKKYAALLSPVDAVQFKYEGVDIKPKTVEAAQNIGEILSESNLDKVKEKLAQLLDDTDKRIVVIMDDIDRLDKEEIQAVFRLVKLTADFPNTIYILSCDVERVAEALAERYGGKEAGRSFLEKIVQLSLPLPPLTPTRLINLTFNNINKLLSDNQIVLPQNEDQDWSYFFITKFGPYLKSPRLVKKYINNLWFSMPSAKEELNIFDFQTIEAVHIFFPDLYETIRSNQNVFLLEASNPFFREEGEKAHLEKLKKIIEEYPEERREAIKEIIQKLFPRTSGAFSNTSHGISWYDSWSKEKRIASPQYCQRYFDLGVSSDDISDSELRQFIENLITKTEEQNAVRLKKFVSNNREELFLQKVSLLVDTLKEDTAIKLAKTISMSGNLFPKGSNDALILALTPFSHAARLMRSLLERIPDNQRREEIAVELARTSSPLDFAYEYFRFAKYIGKDNSEQTNEDQLSALGKGIINKIVERIEVEAKEEYLEKRYPQFSAHLYRAWLFEKPNSAKQYLKNRFTKNPQEAEDFILSFYKQNWDVNGVAILWGFDFVVSAITELHPNIEVLPLDDYRKDASYLYHNQKEYLRYFVSIAKKNA
jgi:predicted KAP-like P-loop ATPase